MRTITTYGPKSADEPIAFAIQDSEGNRKRGARLFFDMKTPDGDEVLSEVPFEWDDDEQTAYLSESFDTSDFPKGVSFGEMEPKVYWSGQGASGTRHVELQDVIARGGDKVYRHTDGGEQYRVHVFEDDGELDVLFARSTAEIDVLVVGGGGGGGGGEDTAYGGGGGGAGGIGFADGLSINRGTYEITIGEGGDGNSSSSTQEAGKNGEDTEAFGFTALGGGGGGRDDDRRDGNDGGSGGGANRSDSNGGVGLQEDNEDFVGYGNDGGDSPDSGAGGGGATERGEDGGSEQGEGGKGGDGIDLSDYFGTQVGDDGWFGGGGAASDGDEESSRYDDEIDGKRRAPPGKGGGGYGGISDEDGQSGQSNTGGGGGGTREGLSGQGGDGVVVVRYRV